MILLNVILLVSIWSILTMRLVKHIVGAVVLRKKVKKSKRRNEIQDLINLTKFKEEAELNGNVYEEKCVSQTSVTHQLCLLRHVKDFHSVNVL